MAKSFPDRRPLPHVSGQQVQRDVTTRGLLVQHISRSIGREVVDDDDLLLNLAQVDRSYRVEQRRDRRAPVVAGDDDRGLQSPAARAGAVRDRSAPDWNDGPRAAEWYHSRRGYCSPGANTRWRVPLISYSSYR